MIIYFIHITPSVSSILFKMTSSSIQTRSKTSGKSKCMPNVPGKPNNTYELRSSTPKENDVQFDFDESSRAWRSNKRSIGNGCYTYLVEASEPAVNTERRQRIRRSPVRYQI